MSTPFDEHWLEMGACVPVDIETVAALVSEIHRLIDVIGGMALAKREWVGLTDKEIEEGQKQSWVDRQAFESAVWWAEEKLKGKNNG